MKYTISELSQITGISVRNIRLYEEYGLINPCREKNQYRSYQAEDAFRLCDFVHFRGLGFSVEEAITLSNSGLCDEYLKMINDRKNKLELQIFRLQSQVENMTGQLDDISFAMKNLNVLLQIDFVPRWFIENAGGSAVKYKVKGQQNTKEWLDCLPKTRHTLLYYMDQPADDGHYYANLGLSVEAEEAKKLDLPFAPDTVYLKMGNCLQVYSTMKCENYLNNNIISMIKNFMFQKSLIADGPLLAIPLFAEKGDNQFFSLFKYILPVRLK